MIMFELHASKEIHVLNKACDSLTKHEHEHRTATELHAVADPGGGRGFMDDPIPS